MHVLIKSSPQLHHVPFGPLTVILLWLILLLLLLFLQALQLQCGGSLCRRVGLRVVLQQILVGYVQKGVEVEPGAVQQSAKVTR